MELADTASIQELLNECRALRDETRLLLGLIPRRPLTVAQAAVQLGCSERQVKRLLQVGDLKRAPSVGRKTLITHVSIDALRLGGQHAAKPKNRKRPQFIPESDPSAVVRLQDFAHGLRRHKKGRGDVTGT